MAPATTESLTCQAYNLLEEEGLGRGCYGKNLLGKEFSCVHMGIAGADSKHPPFTLKFTVECNTSIS